MSVISQDPPPYSDIVGSDPPQHDAHASRLQATMSVISPDPPPYNDIVGAPPQYDANAAGVAAFCLQCGSSLAGGAQFYSQCGSRFGPVEPVQVFLKADRSDLWEIDQVHSETTSEQPSATPAQQRAGAVVA